MRNNLDSSSVGDRYISPRLTAARSWSKDRRGRRRALTTTYGLMQRVTVETAEGSDDLSIPYIMNYRN